MKYFALATLAAVLFSGGLAAQEKSAASEEIQIRQLERAWNQAEAKQEVGAVSALLGEAFVYTDYDGAFMNRVEYLKWMAAPEQKADHLHDEGMTVQVYENSAVVTGIYRESGTNKGKAYVVRSRFTDMWIKRGGVWRCVASHNTLIPAK